MQLKKHILGQTLNRIAWRGSNHPKILTSDSGQEALAIGFAVLIYCLILINRSPNFLRPLSMLVRTGYTLTAPAVFIILYIVFRLPGAWGRFLSWAFILSLFALALAGAWASGTTESGILSGVIPMFDSATYYVDALRLLVGDAFTVTSTRRPLFIAFFSVLLFISKHNLLMALGILNLLVGVSCIFLAKELKRTHGAGMAASALLILFMYYRFHSGAVRTEALGIALSALGVGLFWRGMSRQTGGQALAGILLTTFAMIARAGAFFSLPLWALWGSWILRPGGKGFSWKFLSGGVVLIGSAFLVNFFITRSFGTQQAIPFGNFSYSLYGLAAGGKSWADVLKQYPGASDAEIYQLAFNLIREQPNLIFQGALYNWKLFFSNSNYGLYSFMRGETSASASASYWLLVGLGCLGIVRWLKEPGDRFTGFIGVATAGVLTSVPFLPPTDAFRVRAYAASIVIFGLLPALGVDFLLKRFKVESRAVGQTDLTSPAGLPVFSALFLGFVLCVPFLLRGVETLPDLPGEGCSPGASSLVVHYDPGTMIHLVPQKDGVLDWAPVFRLGGFRRNLHDFPNYAFVSWANEIKPGSSLFYALDLRASGTALILVPTTFLPEPPAMLEVCGMWVEDPEIDQFKVFEALSVTVLEN